ncbi:MAG: cyclase family protein [Chloroflexota bacterium]
MHIYDVTVPIRPGMATYGGTEPGPRLHFHSLISKGDSANVSELSLGSHTGTHVDSPDHFLDNKITVEQMPLDAMVGQAWVADFDVTSHITIADLEAANIPAGTTRLLARTPNGRFWDDDTFHPEFIGFADDAGDWLVERGMVLVGIDYMSIERYHSPTHAVHHALLTANVVIVEGLDLRTVSQGEYYMVCAPIPVVGGDGAPARVYLIEDGAPTI